MEFGQLVNIVHKHGPTSRILSPDCSTSEKNIGVLLKIFGRDVKRLALQH